jgi:hypothetical protein
MHCGRNERRNGEAVGKRNAQHVVAGSFDVSDPDKDQRKCSYEFSEARTEFIHLSMQSNCPCCDNVVIEAVYGCQPACPQPEYVAARS